MEALLHIGLSNAVLATVLALVVAGISRVCRHPALVHKLWILVLLKLITPPLLVVPIAWLPIPSWEGRDEQGQSTAALLDLSPTGGKGSLLQSLEATLQHSVILTRRLWQPALGILWVGGSAFWLFSASRRIRRFQLALRLARPAPARLQQLADDIARRLGMAHGAGVWLMPSTVSPHVWVLGSNARLLLPEKLWHRLDDDQRTTLLVHELAHLQRRDHWIRSLELLVTLLYWWHPVLWWAKRELREAEEQCCDAWVVWALPSAARTYATALLTTLDFLSGAPAAVPLAASGMGQFHHLKRRLTMIMRGRTPKSLSTAGLLTVVCMGAIVLPFHPTRAQTEARSPDDPKDPDRSGEPRAKIEAARQLREEAREKRLEALKIRKKQLEEAREKRTDERLRVKLRDEELRSEQKAIEKMREKLELGDEKEKTVEKLREKLELGDEKEKTVKKPREKLELGGEKEKTVEELRVKLREVPRAKQEAQKRMRERLRSDPREKQGAAAERRKELLETARQKREEAQKTRERPKRPESRPVPERARREPKGTAPEDVQTRKIEELERQLERLREEVKRLRQQRRSS